MGEMERRILRVGGWAGVLAGIIVVVGLITFLLLPVPFGATFPPDLEQDLASFPEIRTNLTVSFALLVVAYLLLIVFLGALYWSLKEPSRAFARIGLGSGVLAVLLSIVGLQGFLLASNVLSALYGDVAVADRPVVVATYGVMFSLSSAVLSTGFLFIGLAFVAFGLAMRGSPDFGEGLAWLSVVLGILIVLLVFPIQGNVGTILIAVLALVLGWKVYSLSRAG